MKQSAAVADFRGGKTSAASLTPRRVIFAAEDARNLAFSLVLAVALGSSVLSKRLARFLFPFPGTGRGGSGAALFPDYTKERGQRSYPGGIVCIPLDPRAPEVGTAKVVGPIPSSGAEIGRAHV